VVLGQLPWSLSDLGFTGTRVVVIIIVVGCVMGGVLPLLLILKLLFELEGAAAAGMGLARNR